MEICDTFSGNARAFAGTPASMQSLMVSWVCFSRADTSQLYFHDSPHLYSTNGYKVVEAGIHRASSIG